VLSRLTDCPLADLLRSGPDMGRSELARQVKLGQAVLNRHRDATSRRPCWPRWAASTWR
jgi:hypothetical protein